MEFTVEVSSPDNSSKTLLLTRRQKLSRMVGYSAAFVALGLVGASLGPTLSGLADNTRTTLSSIGFLFTGRSLGYLVGSFLGGRLYDRLPGHRLMVVALILMAATVALVPTIPLMWLLTAMVLLVGMAEGVVDVGGNTLLVWTFGEEMGPYMNGLHFFFGVGAFLSPIIVAQTVPTSGDVTWAYWVIAVLIMPAAVGLLWLPSPRMPIEPREILAGHKDQTTAGSGQKMLLGLIALFFFLYVGMEVGFGGWAHSYAVELGLSDKRTAAYLTSAFWGALTLGRLAAIPVAARFRPRIMLIADLAGCFCSVLVILAWPNSMMALWVGAIGLGASMASIFPTVLALAERRMMITGKVTGWFLVGSSLGGMTIPWALGKLFEVVGPTAIVVAIGVAVILAAVVFAAVLGHAARVASAASRTV